MADDKNKEWVHDAPMATLCLKIIIVQLGIIIGIILGQIW